ncbi:unnamed protein product [Clavelina lepadiformis]|uniref:Uncharacterized protein n=1 Tax=Clavelina lepadiformis TaxID=159417 RepID=A0ABP0GYL0_CLALP
MNKMMVAVKKNPLDSSSGSNANQGRTSPQNFSCMSPPSPPSTPPELNCSLYGGIEVDVEGENADNCKTLNMNNQCYDVKKSDDESTNDSFDEATLTGKDRRTNGGKCSFLAVTYPPDNRNTFVIFR